MRKSSKCTKCNFSLYSGISSHINHSGYILVFLLSMNSYNIMGIIQEIILNSGVPLEMHFPLLAFPFWGANLSLCSTLLPGSFSVSKEGPPRFLFFPVGTGVSPPLLFSPRLLLLPVTHLQAQITLAKVFLGEIISHTSTSFAGSHICL